MKKGSFLLFLPVMPFLACFEGLGLANFARTHQNLPVEGKGTAKPNGKKLRFLPYLPRLANRPYPKMTKTGLKLTQFRNPWENSVKTS